MKLFSRPKRKHDSLSHQCVPVFVAKEVLTKIDPFPVFSCVSKADSEALISIVTDMANIVNKAFQTEEGILVANGWKIDMEALQRYVYAFMVG
jgi:hypothetical protein